VTVGLAATAAAAAVSIAIRAEKEVAAYANSSTILQVRKIYLKSIPETAKMFFLKSFGLTPVTVYVFFIHFNSSYIHHKGFFGASCSTKETITTIYPSR